MSYYSTDNSGGGFLSSIPTVTKNIIIINVLVFIMTYLNEDFMIRNFALFYPASPFFKPWQFITHMFMHGGIWHIFFNMYTFFIFGCVLERIWGPKKFLLFYFVTGIGAALFHTGVEWIQSMVYMNQIADGNLAAQASMHALVVTPTVGASGAIFGVLMGYAMLFPDSKLTLIFPPVTMTAKWFVVIFALIELGTGIYGSANMGGGIAHFAHLGGMIFGWLLIKYWRKKNEMYTYHD